MSQIILIGYRCTGKSTVGPLLAKKLGWSFVDADEVLEIKYSKTIKTIFAEEGEKGFRDKESTNLIELTQLKNCVLATGGGVVLREENRTLMRKSGWIVWLTASPETIWNRMQIDDTTFQRRPNLSTGGLEEIQSLLEVRVPLYQTICDCQIATEGESPESLADTILGEWILCQSSSPQRIIPG